MENLLELGKNLMKEVKSQYKDCFYRYVDENSFEDEIYIAVGKKLFDNKEKFLDYMNYKYIEDFDWLNSEVNSFDFIQDIVDVAIENSGKYYWDEAGEIFIPVINYYDYDKSLCKLSIPSLMINEEKRICLTMDDSYTRCFLEDVHTGDKIESKFDDIRESIHNIFNPEIIEINGKLNLYYELDLSVWKAKEGSNVIHREDKEFIIEDVFTECLEEMVNSNPEILKKYGLNEINLNIHEVYLQKI